MQPKALLIGDAHVRKPSLPHLAWKSKFLFGAIRKAAFDQLHGLLDAHLAWNGHENVNMIWHDDKVVNDELLGLNVRPHDVDEEFCHAICLEQRLPAYCAGGGKERSWASGGVKWVRRSRRF